MSPHERIRPVPARASAPLSTGGWRAIYWRWLGSWVFPRTPHVAHSVRRALLALAGARVAGNAKVRRSASIDRPWNLRLGPLSIIGDDAVLRLRERISLGARSVVSQRCILSTEMLSPEGNHSSVASPIEIADDCWVAADTLVMPGARVGEGSVVGARAVVCGRLPEWRVCVGMPAVARRERQFLTDDQRAEIQAAGGGPA